MLYTVKVLLAVGFLIAQLALADTKCGANQFACNVDHNHSSACCNQSETCGVSNAGKAQCVIPKKEAGVRTPSNDKAATKFETKDLKKK